MFKNLRKKIEQGVTQSPLRGAVKSPQSANDSQSEPDGTLTKQDGDREEAPSNASPLTAFDRNTATPDTSSEQPNTASPAIGQLVDVPLSDGQSHPLADPSTPTYNNDTPRVSRSRQSSISSVTSESPFFPPLNLSQYHYDLPSEAESEMDEPMSNLDGYTKEDLYNVIKRLERRSIKYKGKFRDIVAAYKDLQQDKEKIKSTLTQSQDKAFRRISELKEQSKLDHLAKRDLEENYRLMLDEKDEFVKVLQTQVRLLKEGKEVPPDIEAKANREPSSSAGEEDTGGGDNSLAILQEKVKRQEGLLNRCKETIKSHKDQIAQLSVEKLTLQQELEKKDGELYKFQEGSDASPSQTSDMAKLRSQIKQARRVIEDLEADKGLAIAEAKQQMHTEIEVKDGELKVAKASLQSLTEENQKLSEKVTKLEKAGEEHLQKSREIIKRVKDEKNQAVQEMEQKLKTFESNMEAEKENLVQELSRGKSAAVDLLQQDLEKRVSELTVERDKALEERDSVWQGKITELEKSHKDLLSAKDKEREHALIHKEEEVQRVLREREDEARLAIEERDLQKMAALSQQDSAKDEILQQMEDLKAVKLELENTLVKIREDHTSVISTWETEKSSLVQSHQDDVARREAQHLENMEKVETEHRAFLREKLEALMGRHSRQLEEVNQKHQEMLQGSSSEVEEFYKTQLETSRSNHEQIMAEKVSQVEKLNSDIIRLNKKLEQSRAETKTRIQSEASVREELIAKYDSEISVLKNDLQTLMQIKDELEKSLVAKKQEMRTLQETFDHRLEGTNVEWKQKLDELETEHAKILSEKCQTDDIRVHEAEEKLVSAETQLQQVKVILESEKNELSEKIASLGAELHESSSTRSSFQTRVQELESSMQTALSEKKTLEQSIVSLKVQVENEAHAAADARQALDSKNEEMANVLKTLEEKQMELNLLDKRCQDLESELSNSVQMISAKEAELQQMKDKFGQLRTEAKSRIKELKESTDNLSASHQLEVVSITDASQKVIAQKQEELTVLTEKFHESDSEKSMTIKSLEERLSGAEESQKALEASFKEKFEERQKQYKDSMQKLKETLQSKVKAKEEEFHIKLEELMKEKEHDAEGVASNLKSIRRQQREELSASNQRQLQITIADWEQKLTEAANSSAAEIAQLKADHDSKLQEIQTSHDASLAEMLSAHKAEVMALQEAASGFVSEKETMINEHQTSMQKHAEMISALEGEFAAVQQRVETVVEKHSLEIQEKNEQLENAGDKIADLEVKNSSLEETLGNLKNISQDSETRINELTQEHRVAMETLQSSQNATFEEKQRTVEELEQKLATYQTSIQDKISVIENVRVERETLQLSHEAVVAEKANLIEKLQHERDSVLSEKDEMLGNLQRELKTLQVAQQSVNDEKDTLLDELQRETSSLQTTLHEKESAIADLKQQVELVSREKDQLRVQHEESLQRVQDRMEAKVRDQQLEMEERLKVALAEEIKVKGELELQIGSLKNDHAQQMQDRDRELSKLQQHVTVLETSQEKIKSLMAESRDMFQSQATEHDQDLLQLRESHANEVQKFREEIQQLRELKDTEICQWQDTIQRMKDSSDEEIRQLEISSQELQASGGTEVANYKLEVEKLNERLSKLKEKAQEKLEEQRKQLREKSSEINEMKLKLDSISQEKEEALSNQQKTVEKQKSDFEEQVKEMDTAHEAAVESVRADYDNRISQLTATDLELQEQLRQLREKLNETEERLHECIQTYDGQITEYITKLDHQETSFGEERNMLRQQLQEMDSQTKLTSAELQTSLQEKVRESEQRMLDLKETRRSEIVELEKKSETSFQELRQKYNAKLKEIKGRLTGRIKELEAVKLTELTERNDQISDLERQLQVDGTEKRELATELAHSNTKLLQLQESGDDSRERLKSTENQILNLSFAIQEKEAEMEKLQKISSERENLVSDLIKSQEATDTKTKEFQTVIAQKEEELRLVRVDLSEKSAKADELESKLQTISDDISLRLETSEKRHSDKMQEQLQSYIESVEVMKTRTKELEDELCKVRIQHEENQSKVSELEDLVRQWKDRFESTEVVLSESKAKMEELTLTNYQVCEQLETAKTQHAAELQEHAQQVESNGSAMLAEYKAKIEELTITNSQVCEQLETAKSQHAAEFQEHAQQVESDGNAKLTEYKKKAEMYLVQMRKQFQGDKDIAITEQREQIHELEDKVNLLREEIDNVKAEKLKLTDDYDKERGNVQASFLQQLNEKDQLIVENRQSAESSRAAELELHESIESLKNAKEELNSKLFQLGKEKQELSDSFEQKIRSLEKEKAKVTKQFEKFKTEKCLEIEEIQRVNSENFSKLHSEYEEERESMEASHSSKIKRLVKEFNHKLAEKEKEFQDIFQEAVGKGNRDEERLMLEHKQTMEELYNDLHDKDRHTEQLILQHNADIKEKEQEAAEKFQSLQNEITSLQEQIGAQEESHQGELQEMEKKLQSSFQKRLADRDAAHSEEIDALSKEWNSERKAHDNTDSSASTSNQAQDLVVHNQLALTAIQSGSTSGDLLRQQILEQDKIMEELRSKHKLEMAELRSELEMTQNRKPLVAPPGHRDLYNEFGQRAAEEIQNLELHNLDLQGEVTHLNEEVSQLKGQNQSLQQKAEDALKGRSAGFHPNPNTPPLSPYPSSPNSLVMGPLLNEATEMEYLKNILFQYMIGKETKTLARVISTVVKFSDDQLRKIIAHEDMRTMTSS